MSRRDTPDFLVLSMPWIHKEDEVGIIIKCIEDERVSGPVNASAPAPVRQATFARTVGRVLGKPVRMRVPGFFMRLFMGEPARAILYNHRMAPEKMLRLDYTFRFPELEGAVRDIVSHVSHVSDKPNIVKTPARF